VRLEQAPGKELWTTCAYAFTFPKDGPPEQGPPPSGPWKTLLIGRVQPSSKGARGRRDFTASAPNAKLMPHAVATHPAKASTPGRTPGGNWLRLRVSSSAVPGGGSIARPQCQRRLEWKDGPRWITLKEHQERAAAVLPELVETYGPIPLRRNVPVQQTWREIELATAAERNRDHQTNAHRLAARQRHGCRASGEVSPLPTPANGLLQGWPVLLP